MRQLETREKPPGEESKGALIQTQTYSKSVNYVLSE